jgi:hypothetical protein
MRSLVLAITAAVLLAGTADAATMTLKSVTVDKAGVVEAPEWTIPEGSGSANVVRTDADGNYTMRYEFQLPGLVPAGGATVTIKATAEARKNAFGNHTSASASISASGAGLNLLAGASARSDETGTATKDATGTLLPSAGGATITVGIQDGPIYRLTYEGAADPAPPGPTCTPTGVRAFMAQKAPLKCLAGEFPFGSDITIPTTAGKATNISPEPVPSDADEIAALLHDLFNQPSEQEQIDAMVAAEVAKDPKFLDRFDGCIFFGTVQLENIDYTLVGGGAFALGEACLKLLRASAAKPRAHAAAAGCRVRFVPAFRKGRKVTKRMRTRAVAAGRRQLAASCTRRADGGIALKLRARAEGKTLGKVLRSRRIRAHATHRGASTVPLKLRWTAKKR